MRIVRTPDSDLARAALEYARIGYRVLPCRPLTKRPAITDWPQRATTDAATIINWWTSNPQYNVAILTGAPGPDVLDIDVREDGSGWAVLEDLRRAQALSGATRRVVTPSGGEHWYFPGTDRRKTVLAPRVDFLAQGSYVMAPPSVLFTNNERVAYRLAEEFCGDGSILTWAALGGPPAVARPTVRAHRRAVVPRSRVMVGPWLSAAPPGERNDRLFRAACELLRMGGDPWNLRRRAEALGLPHDEIACTISSAVRAVGGGRS